MQSCNSAISRIRIGLLLALLVSLGAPLAPASAARVLNVVTTTTDLAYFARQIGGEHVKVESIASPRENIHFVSMKPSILAKLNKADLFIEIGLALEPWVDPLLKRTSATAIRPGGRGLVIAATGCRLLDVPTSRVDRSMGDVHPGGNPHIWLNAANAKQCAANIRDGLIRVDPANSGDYIAHYTALATSLDQAVQDARALLAGIPHPTVVTQHATFAYLFEALGVTNLDLIEPRPGIEPGAQHLAQLKAKMQGAGVRVVITEPHFSPKEAQSVATGVGGTLVILGQHVGSLPNTDTWEALIREDARRIAAALKGATA